MISGLHRKLENSFVFLSTKFLGYDLYFQQINMDIKWNHLEEYLERQINWQAIKKVLIKVSSLPKYLKYLDKMKGKG